MRVWKESRPYCTFRARKPITIPVYYNLSVQFLLKPMILQLFSNPKRSCVFPWRKKNLLWATKHLPREEEKKKRGKLKKNNPFLFDAGGGGKEERGGGEARLHILTSYEGEEGKRVTHLPPPHLQDQKTDFPSPPPPFLFHK